MDGMKVEPVSKEEIHPSDIGIQHTDMNQEEPEPMNFIEVKCEVEEGPAEDYKLNNDEHGTHLKFYDCRYNSATYTIFITN